MNGDAKRDADISCPGWEAGAGLAIDVGVTHPVPPSVEDPSVDGALKLLSNRALRKELKYSDRCSSAGYRFAPLILSSFSTFGPGSEGVWKELSRRLAACRGGAGRSDLLEELTQGLSCALMRGVAAQLETLYVAREPGYVCGSQVPAPPPR